ncbi:MAG: winged helix-turn-helix domain-containing protein [Gemmatimonadota bacterium]
MHELQPRLKVWLNWKGEFLMGPNYRRFLEAVDRTGTIREAGHAVGWSYRTCLNRVRRMEAALGGPVLATSRGGRAHGGARLTPAARELLAVFQEWHDAVREASDAVFARLAHRRR